MQITKNVWKGGEITDLNELVELSRQKKSVVLRTGDFFSVRPAAFIIQWSIAMIINHKIYYGIHERDIAVVEFEETI